MQRDSPTYPGVPQAVTITGISSGSLLSFDNPKSLIIILESSLLHVKLIEQSISHVNMVNKTSKLTCNKEDFQAKEKKILNS